MFVGEFVGNGHVFALCNRLHPAKNHGNFGYFWRPPSTLAEAMRLASPLIALLLILSLPAANGESPTKTLQGQVVAIADGDTLIVLDADKTQHKVRLDGIDTPEKGQAFGTQARKALADKVFRQQVRIEWKRQDRYGRVLGQVHIGDRWINLELIAEGMAWHYKQYNSDAMLAAAEVQARKSKVGLWAESAPIPPWDFRRGVRSQTDAQPPPPLVDGADGPIVYVTKTCDKYHADGCRYLSKSKIPISLSYARAKYEPCPVCNPPR